MKISVIGAGNVGATAANMIALKGFAHEVVLLDIKPGFAEGKAMDMMQTAHMLGIDTRIQESLVTIHKPPIPRLSSLPPDWPVDQA